MFPTCMEHFAKVHCVLTFVRSTYVLRIRLYVCHVNTYMHACMHACMRYVRACVRASVRPSVRLSTHARTHARTHASTTHAHAHARGCKYLRLALLMFTPPMNCHPNPRESFACIFFICFNEQNLQNRTEPTEHFV